jgi:hypothetical protein
MLSFTVMLPNEQRIEVSETVVRWPRGKEFAGENVVTEQHTSARLRHYMKRLIKTNGDDL